ncbi:MAG TPA: ZIP family metal transporter [Paludibacteraceae bacterium]|nr:ZIP family metal transporter [Paludibacteraceae bacterium]
MDMTWLYALVSTLVVSLISLIGVFLLSFKAQQLHRVLILLVCFSIGAMLGNTFFELLPESFLHNSDASLTGWLAIGGFLVFFVLEQFLHMHQHSHSKGKGYIKSYGYLSLYADSIHNFTDGILIGAAWMFTPEIGLATTFAILLHEIPQEISDFGILLQAGFSKRKALLNNFYAACTAILGTIITLAVGEEVEHLSVYILPVAAGGFIYLACSSLLPEILKETTKKNYLIHLLFILLGLYLMYFFSIHGGHQH